MIKRDLYCSVCEREVEGSEEIYAKMKAPEKTAMVEIVIKNNLYHVNFRLF